MKDIRFFNIETILLSGAINSARVCVRGAPPPTTLKLSYAPVYAPHLLVDYDP